MGPRKKQSAEVEFFFEESADFKLIPANGMWGGITTRGDFRLDFFVETIATPESITYPLNPDGTLGPELKRKPSTRYVRRLEAGVLMSLETAELLSGFIKDRIAEYKKLKAKKDTKNNHV